MAAQNQKIEYLFAAQVTGQGELAKLTQAVDSLRKEMDALKSANGGLAAGMGAFSKNVGNASSHVQAYRKHLDDQAKAMRNSRIGTMQAGMQVNDFVTSVSTGASPVQAFNQQIGQVGYAMQMMGGTAGKVGNFLAGPWSILVIGASMAIGALIENFMGASDESKKLENGTIDLSDSLDIQKLSTTDLIKAIDQLDAAQKRANRSSFESAVLARDAAKALFEQAVETRTLAQNTLIKALADFYSAKGVSKGGGEIKGAFGAIAAGIQAEIKSLDVEIKKAASSYASTKIPVIQREAAAATDASAAATLRREKAEAQLQKTFLANGNEKQYREGLIRVLNTEKKEREAAGKSGEAAARRIASAMKAELNQANQIAEKIRDMAIVYGDAGKEAGTAAKKLDDFNDMVKKLEGLNGGAEIAKELKSSIDLVRKGIEEDGAKKALSSLNEEMDKLLKKDLSPFEQAVSSLSEKLYNPELPALDPEEVVKYYSTLNAVAGKFFDDAIKSQLDLFGKAVGVDDAFQMQVDSLRQIIAILTEANIPVDELNAKLEQLLSINKTTEMVEKNKELQDSFKAIGESVSDAFKGMLTGAMSWKDGMRSLIGSVIDQLWKLFVVQKIVGVISSALGGSSNMPGNMGSAADAFKLLPPVPIPANAYGGSVMGNKPTLVGERGPELFIPGGNGTIIPNSNMRGGGGGGSPINISVDARGSNDPAAVRAQVQQGILEAAPAIIAAAESRTISNLRRPRLGGAMQ